MGFYNDSLINLNVDVNGITKIDNTLDYQSNNPISNKAVYNAIDDAIAKCKIGIVWCESGTPDFNVEDKTLTLPAGTRLILGNEVIANIEEETIIGYMDDLHGHECPNGYIVYNIDNEYYVNMPVTDTVPEKHVLLGAYSNYGESAFLFGNYTINGVTPIADGSVTNSKLADDVIRNQTAMIIPSSTGNCVHVIGNLSDVIINGEMIKRFGSLLMQIQKGSYIVCGNKKIEISTVKALNLLQTPGLTSITDGGNIYVDVYGFATYNINTGNCTLHAVTEDIPENEFFVCGYYFNSQTKAYHLSINASYTTTGSFFNA